MACCTLFDKLWSKLEIDLSGIKVNILTLKIHDESARKDFHQHKIEMSHKKALFIVIQIFVMYNLIFRLYGFFG